jgi:hypothetical protein
MKNQVHQQVPSWFPSFLLCAASTDIVGFDNNGNPYVAPEVLEQVKK